MKNVVILGSSGMIGKLVLALTLNNPDIQSVTAIVRKKSGVIHPKLKEVIHKNFYDFSSITDEFRECDTCFFCIGVYTGVVPKDEFIKVTVDIPRAFSKAITSVNKEVDCCFLSGAGADQRETSKILFAREKGKAENILRNQGFKNLYIFRPGYIYPVEKRQEPNRMYSVTRIIYGPLKKLYKDIGVSSEELAKVMVGVAMDELTSGVYENKDIRKYYERNY